MYVSRLHSHMRTSVCTIPSPYPSPGTRSSTISQRALRSRRESWRMWAAGRRLLVRALCRSYVWFPSRTLLARCDAVALAAHVDLAARRPRQRRAPRVPSRARCGAPARAHRLGGGPTDGSSHPENFRRARKLVRRARILVGRHRQASYGRVSTHVYRWSCFVTD